MQQAFTHSSSDTMIEVRRNGVFEWMAFTDWRTGYPVTHIFKFCMN